ncbi:DUF3290 domain-containing protein [Sporolactobacillus sp. STSJ-5]|uniref:DUF3290 family protein n=1 Tax=Sporolactobacillus sp. STSJ-5 TaxID=2965076 RepID=UPI002101F2DB|nr:DUF3290 family protein [Sporolactobacillus sp. STSJ-5]MCQ2009305.1 DUF3290 domain-containing protein [Sporolactobacillus sp. STSJ-5]
MNFYSYHYIESQTDTAVYVQIAFMAAIFLALLFLILRFRIKRMPYKYKEISVLLLVLLILLGGIQVNDWVNKEHTQSEYRGVLNEMKQLAKDLDVPVNQIYTNHMTPEEIMLYKVGKNFFRLEHNEDDPAHYVLEQIHVLNGTAIKMVDK